MGILQIQQVRNRLESVFFPLLDLHDISSHPESSLTNFKLTRALTAFVMMKRSQLSAEEAAQCITDGTGDNGLDGIALVPEENKIILVQSKWSETGKGSAELAEMIKFRDGVNDLLSLRWHKFNEKIRAREKEILDVLMQPDIKIDIVFAHMGTGALAGQVKDTMEEFVTDQNDSVSDALNFTYLAQTHIHRMLVEEQQAGEIDLTVSLSDWGSIEGPPKAVYGHVRGIDVADWLNTNGTELLARNVRVFLGDSEVNKSIKETALTAPEQFWYLNNGITVLCRSFDKSVAGGSDRRHGNYVIRGASVVNGAQTVGALASLNRDTHKDALETLRVTVRFIALDEADEDFGNRVTRATNTQNRIGGRDFVGLDPEQTRLRDEFAVDGLIYAVRNGEPDPEDLVGCSFDDAVVAIACSSTDVNLATQAKREVSKLYLDTTKAPYKTLFNAQTTSTAVWRRVQVLRHVEGYLSSSTRTWTDSREKGFAVHGNRLVLHLVFAQLDRKVLDDPNIDGPTDKDLLDMATERAFSTMKAAAEERFDGYLAHLFKNAAKVRIIRERAIQLMSSPPQSVSP